jgi:hypothetical protein
MANDTTPRPKTAQEQPGPAAASHPPTEPSVDRPGFDLGGAQNEKTGTGSSTIPGGPQGSVAKGSGVTGRATGLTDPSGGRSLGNEGDAGSESGSGPTDGSGGPS